MVTNGIHCGFFIVLRNITSCRLILSEYLLFAIIEMYHQKRLKSQSS